MIRADTPLLCLLRSAPVRFPVVLARFVSPGGESGSGWDTEHGLAALHRGALNTPDRLELGY